MSLKLYFDHHVDDAIAEQLRRRGVDVVLARDVGGEELLDSELLDQAGALGRLLFTQDQDFLAAAALRQRAGRQFPAVLFGPQRANSVGQYVADLELIAKAGKTGEFDSRVLYLPLR